MNMFEHDAPIWETGFAAVATSPFEVMGVANGFDPDALPEPKPVAVAEDVAAPAADEPVTAVVQPGPQAMVHQGRIRTGQRVVNESGDLIVFGDVNPGAELVAAGHVHVYGTLAGRVFAGAGGHPEARVFCLRFQAELVAIGGYYRVFETVPTDLLNRAVGFNLTDNVLHYAPLNTAP